MAINIEEILNKKGDEINITEDGSIKIIKNKRNILLFERASKEIMAGSEGMSEIERAEKLMESYEKFQKTIDGMITGDIAEYAKKRAENEMEEELIQEAIIQEAIKLLGEWLEKKHKKLK